MAHLGTVGELLQSGTMAEQRDVVRGLVEEIAWDGEKREGEIVFRAVPQLSETSPELIALDPSCSRKDADASCAEVAGAQQSRKDAACPGFQADIRHSEAGCVMNRPLLVGGSRRTPTQSRKDEVPEGGPPPSRPGRHNREKTTPLRAS
jgi:hypothetical protein